MLKEQDRLRKKLEPYYRPSTYLLKIRVVSEKLAKPQRYQEADALYLEANALEEKERLHYRDEVERKVSAASSTYARFQKTQREALKRAH